MAGSNPSIFESWKSGTSIQNCKVLEPKLVVGYPTMNEEENPPVLQDHEILVHDQIHPGEQDRETDLDQLGYGSRKPPSTLLDRVGGLGG